MDVDMDIDVLIPQGPDISPEEREQRRTAIRKFMERKKVAQLTEQLRVRLSYASFKASRGYSSLPFSKLDPLVDQEIAARSPSPSVSSSITSSSFNGGGGRKKPGGRARPSSYHQGMSASALAYGRPVGLGMRGFGSMSTGTSPNLDHFPTDPNTNGLPAPGSLYLALFGSQPAGLGVSPSPLKHSPSLSYSTNGRKRTLGAAGSLPPPESPRKHRRTTGSASFSHPPRGAAGRALQEEAANAAAILTSFLQSSQEESSPSLSQSQSTQVDGISQGPTLVNSIGSQESAHSIMSRASSSSSAGVHIKSEPGKQNGLAPPFSVETDSRLKPPSTPPRTSAAPAMPAMDAAETLVYLATSPSPARPPKHSVPSSSGTSMSSAARVLFAPSTPVQAHHSHANSHSRSASTPNAQAHTTPYGFSFSDFVNVSPSPGQATGPFRRDGVSAEADGKGLAGLQAPPGIY